MEEDVCASRTYTTILCHSNEVPRLDEDESLVMEKGTEYCGPPRLYAHLQHLKTKTRPSSWNMVLVCDALRELAMLV